MPKLVRGLYIIDLQFTAEPDGIWNRYGLCTNGFEHNPLHALSLRKRAEGRTELVLGLVL